jgi:hypothetical protein
VVDPACGVNSEHSVMHCNAGCGFLKEAGFDVLWAGNFVDQGWFSTQDDVNKQRWIFDGDLAANSFDYVAEKAPQADAYLANGMVNFRTGPNQQPQRMLHLTSMLEDRLGKPVIAHDTALYWRIFKSLGAGSGWRERATLEVSECIRSLLYGLCHARPPLPLNG